MNYSRPYLAKIRSLQIHLQQFNSERVNRNWVWFKLFRTCVDTTRTPLIEILDPPLSSYFIARYAGANRNEVTCSRSQQKFYVCLVSWYYTFPRII